MEKEKLIKLIEGGLSTYKIAKEINLSPSNICYWIKKLELSELYMQKSQYARCGAIIKKYSKDSFIEIAKASVNYSDMIYRLGMIPRGKNFETIKKYIKLYEVDCSHFNSKIKILGLRRVIDINDYLRLGSNIKSNPLKLKLYKSGLKNRACEICGQGETWMGKQIALILDHKNGNSGDNRIENLRIVCPNCNASLDTHCGKNIKKKACPLS